MIALMDGPPESGPEPHSEPWVGLEKLCSVVRFSRHQHKIWGEMNATPDGNESERLQMFMGTTVEFNRKKLNQNRANIRVRPRVRPFWGCQAVKVHQRMDLLLLCWRKCW